MKLSTIKSKIYNKRSNNNYLAKENAAAAVAKC